MGKNKLLRTKIEGHQNQIDEHYDKIRRELTKKYPDKRSLAIWNKHIQKHLMLKERLERKLPGGRK